jgi:hypothetical protein
VLRTRQAGCGQLVHCSLVAVMVGQPVTGPGGAVSVVVPWLPVAATGAMLCEEYLR